MKTSPVRWVVRVVLWTVAAAVLAVATLIGVMWLDHRAQTSLPTPTGPLPVGRTIQVWTDETVDPLAPGCGIQQRPRRPEPWTTICRPISWRRPIGSAGRLSARY